MNSTEAFGLLFYCLEEIHKYMSLHIFVFNKMWNKVE